MRETLAWHGDGRGFHIMQMLFTGVSRLPVGSVGNNGRLRRVQGGFSKTPELHSRDLENLSLGQLARPQPLRRDFHFSCGNYGDYYLFLSSYNLFPHPSRCMRRGEASWGLTVWLDSFQARNAESVD